MMNTICEKYSRDGKVGFVRFIGVQNPMKLVKQLDIWIGNMKDS